MIRKLKGKNSGYIPSEKDIPLPKDNYYYQFLSRDSL